MAKKKKGKANEQVIVVLILAALAGLLVFLFMHAPSRSRASLSETIEGKASIETLKNGDDEDINEGNPGESIDISRWAVSDKYTIFDFSSAYCPACNKIAPDLAQLTKLRTDIAVRGIDVDRPKSEGIDWKSPICLEYRIHSLPYFIIYGPNKKLMAKGDDARQQVIDMIRKEMYQ